MSKESRLGGTKIIVVKISPRPVYKSCKASGEDIPANEVTSRTTK